MKITAMPQDSFDMLVIDTVGTLRKTTRGIQNIITMICELSKYLIAVPAEPKDARTVARAVFNHLILIFDPIKAMKTDLCTEFKNETLAELNSLLNTEHNLSTAYRHQMLGTVERIHRV